MNNKINNLKNIYKNIQKINPKFQNINLQKINKDLSYIDSLFSKSIYVFNQKIAKGKKIELLSKYLVDPHGKKLFTKKVLNMILERYSKSNLFAYKTAVRKSKKVKRNMKGGSNNTCKINLSGIQDVIDHKIMEFMKILGDKKLTMEYFKNNLDIYQDLYNMFRDPDEIPELQINFDNPEAKFLRHATNLLNQPNPFF